MVYKIAVITRTKDRLLFLERALQSVARQTLKDYIHVIVNDGGDREHVDSLVARQSDDVRKHIQVFHRTSASGAPDTIFNESIDRVDSVHVAIHDDDDSWHPEFLARTVKLLDDGAKGVVVRTDKVYEELKDGTIKTRKTERYQSDIKAVSIYRQLIDNQLTPISFIYQRDAYKEIGKYDDSLPVIGDWEFGIRFLLKYDVEFLDPGLALAHYHHRVGGKKDNSFALHSHRYYFNKVANKHFRAELQAGTLGIGYLMNKLRYDQSNLAAMAKKILPGFVTDRLKRRIQR